MFRTFTVFAAGHEWLLLFVVGLVGFAAGLAAMRLLGVLTGRRYGEQALLSLALNNMSQALLMLHKSGRVILCNDRYMQMYKLSPGSVKPGCMLRDILVQRKAVGTFSGDPVQYAANVMREVAEGKPTVKTVELSGRSISISNRPMAGGGWISTHEDVTDRQRAERQSASLAEQQKRRMIVDEAIRSFRDDVASVLATVGESALAMKSTVTAMSTSSDETSRRATHAVNTSNEASGNVGAAAAAAEQLSTSISEISRQIVQASDLVRTTEAEAHTTNEEMARLAQAAKEIDEVVKLIRHIAGQTNLLALNATIEAARAGDAGKGFAVVASEVKSLAVQTGKATEQIVAQISAVQSSTTGAVDAIRRNAERMREINSLTSAIAAALDQQKVATGEISSNVGSAAAGTRAVVSVLDEVAGAVSRTRGAADTVLAATHAVETAAGRLSDQVEGFLKKVAV